MQAFLEPLKELADYQEIVSSRRKKTGFQQIARSEERRVGKEC